MPQFRTKTVKPNTAEATNGAAPARKPSEQALEVVDVTFGLAEAARKRVEQLRDSSTREQELKRLQQQVEALRNPSTRDAELETLRKRLDDEVEKAKAEGPAIRRKVTGQLVEQAKKARKRVEPVVKQRVEPVVKQRVEPVYKQRVEPTVRKVAERI